jgi:hypothetical protein
MAEKAPNLFFNSIYFLFFENNSPSCGNLLKKKKKDTKLHMCLVSRVVCDIKSWCIIKENLSSKIS